MVKATNKNIVLDLDSTIVHTSSDLDDYYKSMMIPNPNNDSVHRVIPFKLESKNIDPNEREMWTVLRPYTKEFLEFCTRYFNKIIIFTAGQEEYAHKIKNILEEALGNKFADVVYSYNYCYMPNKKTIHKPISIFKNNVHLLDVTEENTFALDDRHDTFHYNKDNGILIPPYEPELNDIHREDHALLQLMGWLSLPEVLNCSDVRLLEKKDIFNISIDKYREYIDDD